jgi:RNA polymerase sigma-70 factor (ECF subfamily)
LNRLAMWMERRRFEAAVERHQRRVFTLAWYLLSDREEAEDVTQDVLIQMWRGGGRIAPERLETWLLRVTRNASYDRLRHRRSAAKVFAADPADEATGTVAADGPSPEHVAGGSEVGQRVYTALTELREPVKSIVILREIQGLSYQAIADVLELPVSTVRVSLYRGRRRLRELLKEVYRHVSAS